MQFDKAVTWFGRYVEAKCSETDSRGNTRHSLESVLGDDKNSVDNTVAQLIGLFGVIER